MSGSRHELKKPTWNVLNNSYLKDLGGTFDIESLSMLLTTNSLLRKNNVPLDTLTGIRMRSATIVTGTNIFKLNNKR